jgi:hypothetical protein
MRDLAIHVTGADASRFSAAPQIDLHLRVTAPASVHGALLRCQVRIDAPRRAHDTREVAALADVFGPPSDWGRSLRSLLWTNTALALSPFDAAIDADLALPCSYDFALATTKYFHALEGADVPLTLLFSGTVFHDVDGGLRAAPIASTLEARYALPLRVHAEAVARAHDGGVPVPLRRDVFDRLLRYRTTQQLPTWERAIEALLDGARGE